MRRRQFLARMAATGMLARSPAMAQPMPKRPLIGYLSGNFEAPPDFFAFLRGMTEQGYVEGKDYEMVARWADNQLDRLPALAEELVRLKPDLIESDTNAGTVAAAHVTNLIPIVCPILIEPTFLGLAKSVNRPQGNVTGRLLWTDTLPGKQLQLAMEAIPATKTIGMLVNVSNVTAEICRKDAEAAALALGLKLLIAEVRLPQDLDGALSALRAQNVDFLYGAPDTLLNSNRKQIAEFALQARLPTIHLSAQYARDGWLMAYGVDIPDTHRRGAAYVAKILRGAKPGELPLEFPSELKLALNLRTAAALGLTFPRSLFAQADEVIE
jgi:putative ABC transport system substrate-binding protein